MPVAKFTCPYIIRGGSVCQAPCARPEGCKLHWRLVTNPLPRQPCLKCGKVTTGKDGLCGAHNGTRRTREWRQRKKAQKEAEAEQARAAEAERQEAQKKIDELNLAFEELLADI